MKNRGIQDVFIACVDGLSGFPEAIETVYPQAQVQPCIVHLVRNSLKYVSWKQRKAVADGLKKIYKAATIEEAELALDTFVATAYLAQGGNDHDNCETSSLITCYSNIVRFVSQTYWG